MAAPAFSFHHEDDVRRDLWWDANFPSDREDELLRTRFFVGVGERAKPKSTFASRDNCDASMVALWSGGERAAVDREGDAGADLSTRVWRGKREFPIGPSPGRHDLRAAPRRKSCRPPSPS